MKYHLSLVVFSLFAAVAQAAPLQVTAEEWARPRSGEVLVRHPSLNQAVRQLLEDAPSRLQIRYPGGDEGTLWASEARAWLVALGLESDRIELVPGASSAEVLELLAVER